MKTKLEMMADYLAGRRDASAELIRQELGDPSSEACGFLEALQDKSRGALAVIPSTAPNRRPGARGGGPIARALAGEARIRLAVLALVVTALLIAVAAAWWTQTLRLRSIEASLVRGTDSWRERLGRLETAVDRGAQANESALARLEVALGKLERRLGQPRAARLDPDDATVSRLRRDLDDLRQDLVARTRADRQELEDVRSIIDEALRSLRRLEARPPAQPPARVPVPVLIPMPAPGQAPALEPVEISAKSH
jgi:hypothetical protein